MLRNREPFSLERHQDVAGLLVRLSEEMSRLGRDIGHAYGASAAAEALDAVTAIDRVRGNLDALLARELPCDPAQINNIRLGSIYFPHWAEQRKAG
jgi:hypothetical protein